MRHEERRTWAVVGLTAAAGAAVATRWALRKGWTAAFAEEPPDNPASPEVGWRSALAWAAVSGMVVEGARVIAKRLAVEAYEAVAGRSPPLTAGAPRR